MPIDVTKYWTEPPPEPSPGLIRWTEKIKAGWKPNARIGSMGYHEKAVFFKCYIWEYLNVISPLIQSR